jgi:hypothetical protein
MRGGGRFGSDYKQRLAVARASKKRQQEFSSAPPQEKQPSVFNRIVDTAKTVAKIQEESFYPTYSSSAAPNPLAFLGSPTFAKTSIGRSLAETTLGSRLMKNQRAIGDITGGYEGPATTVSRAFTNPSAGTIAMAGLTLGEFAPQGRGARALRLGARMGGGYSLDPKRIAQSARELSGIGERILQTGRAGRPVDVPTLRQEGFTGDPRDIYPISSYGTFTDIESLDPAFVRALSARDPESVMLRWDTPEARTRSIFQTLRDPLRFGFTLSQKGKQRLINSRVKQVQREIKRGERPKESERDIRRRITSVVNEEAIPSIRGVLPPSEFARSRPRTLVDPSQADILSERYGRLVEALNPGLILPKGITSRIGSGTYNIPGGGQGEHNVFPAGGYNIGLKNLFDRIENQREELFEQVPPLTETVQGDIGLETSKLINMILASGSRTVDEAISPNAPAFREAASAYPEAVSRNIEAGLLRFYDEDLARALINAPDLAPLVLREIEGIPQILASRRRLDPRSLFII